VSSDRVPAYQVRDDQTGAVFQMAADSAGVRLTIQPTDAADARCRLGRDQLRELQSWIGSHGRDLLTDAEIAAVPIGTVVRAADGTIAARYDSQRGVVFGYEQPFPWEVLRAPGVILWSVGDQASAQAG